MASADVNGLLPSTIRTLEATASHYSVAKDDKRLRKTFHEAGRGLGLVRQALQAVIPHLGGYNLSQSSAESLQACSTKAKLSHTIFKDVAEAPEDSRFERYKTVVKHQGQGRTVEVLMMGMMNDVCTLAEDDAIKVAMEDEVNELRGAIEKLSQMEPSVSKEGSGDTFNSYGSGDMLNVPGGEVNKSSGDNSRHFPGAKFFGNLTFN